jgi:hypothetical protein
MVTSWGRPTFVAGVALTALAVVGGVSVAWLRSDPSVRGWGGAARPTTQTQPAVMTSTASSPTATAQPSTQASPSRSTTTAPSRGGKPGPANTGVPAGTRLTVVNGDRVYTTNNQVISGVDIHGFVRIRARNVTIRNSIVRGGDPRCNSAVIFVERGWSAKIEDSEIIPTNPNPCLDGIWAENATLTRLDVRGVVDGVKAFDNVTLRDSYVHDLSWFASDPNQGGGPTHNDAVQTYEGNQHIILRHNTLDAEKGNAAYQVTQDSGKIASDLHIEYNWLDGGGCTLNFAHKGGPTPMTGIYVVGNRFGRHSVYNCPILVSTRTMLSRNSGNVWDDTGRPIPPPQRHD